MLRHRLERHTRRCSCFWCTHSAQVDYVVHTFPTDNNDFRHYLVVKEATHICTVSTGSFVNEKRWQWLGTELDQMFSSSFSSSASFSSSCSSCLWSRAFPFLSWSMIQFFDHLTYIVFSMCLPLVPPILPCCRRRPLLLFLTNKGEKIERERKRLVKGNRRTGLFLLGHCHYRWVGFSVLMLRSWLIRQENEKRRKPINDSAVLCSFFPLPWSSCSQERKVEDRSRATRESMIDTM